MSALEAARSSGGARLRSRGLVAVRWRDWNVADPEPAMVASERSVTSAFQSAADLVDRVRAHGLSQSIISPDSLREPEGHGSCDADGREEGIRAAVVAGGDPAPVLEAADHVLDAVSLAMQAFVVGELSFAASRRGDPGGDAALQQRGAEPVAVVAAVGDQLLGWRQRG